MSQSDIALKFKMQLIERRELALGSKLEIRKHLHKLGNGEIRPKNEKRGICHELYYKFRVDEYMLCKRLALWDKSSASTTWPMPGGLKKYLEYFDIKNMWDPNDEYGALRLEACRWLAENY